VELFEFFARGLADERFSPTTAGQQPSSAGAVLYPLTDQQNTVRELVDTSGTVVNHLTYDSFGKVTAETNAAVDYLFGYAGMERDAALNLNRADHRYYDAGHMFYTREADLRQLKADLADWLAGAGPG